MSTQAEVDRLAQIREARGRVYTDFLDSLYDLKISLRSLQRCVTDSIGAPPLQVFLTITTVTARDGQSVECEQAPRQYATDRMRVQRIHGQLTVWSSAEFMNRASLILSTFPEIDYCTAHVNSARDEVMKQCDFSYRDMSPLLHLWYAGGLFGVDNGKRPPAIEPTDPTSSEFETATKVFETAFGKFDRDFIIQLVDVGIRQVRRQFCEEVAAPGTSCE
ncbi:hypothetical protein [Catellatospora paridis]|uniref:hypothetical protein n=1 Tax=Catellatospora paridis TaxID=1617086 RepID=UPI0012D4821E|nr:hypothetical protein [Catellatospora paridis]